MIQNCLKQLTVLFLLAFSLTAVVRAQDSAGLTGTVTDASGAVVPDTLVTLTNPARGLKFTAKTNSEGTYRFPNVPPNRGYQVQFLHEGFAATTVTDVVLSVGITQTQNGQLNASSTTTVEVSAGNKVVTLNTTDASVGNNIDVEVINDLPVQNRNSPAALFNLQPGVTLNGSVTGARTDQTSVTVDGMDVNDISTGQFGNTNAGIPVDATQEFRGTVAGLPAGLGTGSGGQFQLVTKSGSNRFHGLLYEYHRDTTTVSNLWFNNNSGIGRTPLIRNQFGGNIGGPIFRDKLFFFLDFANSRIVTSATGVDTVPLDDYRAGIIHYVKTGCSASTRLLTNPACVGTYTPAQVKALDPAGIGESTSLFALINSRYLPANDLSGGDGINSGYYRFTQKYSNIIYNGVGRLDYNLSSKQRLFVQFHNANQDSLQAVNRFATDPVTRPFQDRSYGYVASHVWQIGANKVNQFYYGTNVTVFSFPLTFTPPTSVNPNSANYLGSLSGLYTTPYDANNIQRRRLPIPTVRDDFNWTKGEHNISFGASFKFIKGSNFLGTDYNSYTLGLGGNVGSLIASLRPGDIQASGTTNTLQWDRAFALSLGRVANISSIYNFTADGTQLPSGSGSNRRFRYYQTEAYVSDTWKINKQLTFTYGLRYDYYSVPYETTGAESIPNLSFDDYFNARIKQSASSAFTASSVPFLVYNLGGKANNAPGYYSPSPKDFAPRIAIAYNPSWLPHTVFNASGDVVYDRTVVNAINFLQNQNTFVFQNNIAKPYGNSADPTGSLRTDPRVGTDTVYNLPAAPTVAAPSKPYTPYVNSAGVPTGLNTQNGTYVIDKNFKDPYNITANLGIQQELGHGFILRTNYAGRFGRRLIGQADASQLIDTADPVSGQSLSSAFAAVTTQLRAGVNPLQVTQQPFFTNQIKPGYGASRGYGNNSAFVAYNYNSLATLGDITDIVQGLAASSLIQPNLGLGSQFARATFVTNKGFSTYHGLLVTLSKNISNGIRFDLNYTWQHSIDNVSLIANASASGTGFICDALRPRACRGNSDFDAAHNFNGDVVTQLPFGRGRLIGRNAPLWLDEIIGGWDLSAIPQIQSGLAYTTSTGAFLAGFANNVPAIQDNSYTADTSIHLNKDSSNRLLAFRDVNKALAHFRGPVGIEYGSRNNLRGPAQVYFDAGLAKSFRILPDNRLNLKFRADAFNVLNHPSFATPAAAINNASTFGQITAQNNTYTNATRVGQFALRLEF